LHLTSSREKVKGFRGGGWVSITKSDGQNLYRFLCLAISPLLVFLLVIAVQGPLSNRSDYNLLGGIMRVSVVFLFYSFFTQGHVTAVYYRALGDREVRQKTIWKTILSTLFLLIVVPFTKVGFFSGALIFVFWVNYHYVRQHFGVLRILSPKRRLGSKIERYLDTFFCFTVYLIPIFAYLPLVNFDPVALATYMEEAGFRSLISPLMALIEFCVKTSQWLFPLFLPVWLIYIGRLFWVSFQRREGLDHVCFAATFAFLIIAGSLWLGPENTMLCSVFLHSVQYYYIVGTDFSKTQNSTRKLLYSAAPILSSLAFGFLFTAFPIQLYMQYLIPRFMVLAGFGIAANLVHFYIDGYVWRR